MRGGVKFASLHLFLTLISLTFSPAKTVGKKVRKGEEQEREARKEQRKMRGKAENENLAKRRKKNTERV